MCFYLCPTIWVHYTFMALQTMCNIDDVVFELCISGRGNYSINPSNIVGLFMNTVFFRLKTEKNKTASSLLKLIHKQSIEINEFDFLPIEYIEEELGVISYWLLSFEKYYENYSHSILKPVLIREELDYKKLVDVITLPDGTMKVIFVFNPRHYRKHTIERLFSLIEKFMLDITNNPDVIVSSLIQGQR